MVPLPKVEIKEKTPQYDLVSRFCSARFWEEQYDELFAPDLVVDFPHAPPGMLQHLDRFEFDAFRFWLRNTVREMEAVGEVTIIPTTDPQLFFAVRFCKGTVYWAKKEGEYANEHAMKIVVRDGKIAYLKDYFNPLAFYRALDIVLPAFVYDPDPNAANTRMPEGEPSRLTEAQNRQRVHDNFLNPINFDNSLESIYAADIVMVCPNVPYSMPEAYEGVEFDIENKWMYQVCQEMVGPDSTPSYESADGNWLILEENCYMRTLWSGHDGHYTQRELYMVYMVEGKIKHFRVYFNPLNKFSSMNQSVPSFPYFNF